MRTRSKYFFQGKISAYCKSHGINPSLSSCLSLQVPTSSNAIHGYHGSTLARPLLFRECRISSFQLQFNLFVAILMRWAPEKHLTVRLLRVLFYTIDQTIFLVVIKFHKRPPIWRIWSQNATPGLTFQRWQETVRFPSELMLILISVKQ